MLARLTGNAGWLDGAQHARSFVEAMYNSSAGFFWTGTSDPTHIFFDNIPEDGVADLVIIPRFPRQRFRRFFGVGENQSGYHRQLIRLQQWLALQG